MKKYHYYDGDNQFGPLTIDELKDKKISRDTLVWYDGLDNWTKAIEVEELKEIFKLIPPPLNLNNQTPPPINLKVEQTNKKVNIEIPKKNKKGLKKWIIICGLIVLGIISYVAIRHQLNNQSSNYDSNSYDSSNENSNSESTNQSNNYNPPKQKTAEELRQELYYKEKTKPKDYLSLTYKLNYKVLSGKDEVVGKIYNSASTAKFKDVVLTVQYSTGTGTALKNEDFVVYQYVYPNSSTSFNFKTVSPKGTKQIGIIVKGAIGE